MYEGVYGNFAALWRECKLADKQVVCWFEHPNGVTEPYWGNIIGITNLANGADVLLHIKVSNEGDMVFIPLSQAVGRRGFEIRVTPEGEEEKESKDESGKV